jgi:hypothetical protein
MFALSEAIDSKDRERRRAAMRKLKRARAERLGVRSADVVGPTASSGDTS